MASADGLPDRRPASGLLRLTRTEVGKLLTDTKLDAQMKAFAQWGDYQAGRRGVNK